MSSIPKCSDMIEEKNEICPYFCPVIVKTEKISRENNISKDEDSEIWIIKDFQVKLVSMG
jgi:hypothetical protein